MKRITTTIIASFALASIALAADSGLYAGAGVGYSPTQGATHTVFGGYQLTQQLGFEAGFAKVTASGEGEGVELTGVVSFPARSKASAYGSLGALFGDRDTLSPILEAGVAYPLTASMSIRAGLRRYWLIEGQNINVFNTAAAFKF